jgi:hypothetical protein
MKIYCVLGMLVLINSQIAIGQLQKQYYAVYHNDKAAGQMQIAKTGNTQSFTIKLTFSASLRILFKHMDIEGQEETLFENGIMKHSLVLRRVNGKIKSNKRTKQTGNAYEGFDGTSTWSIPITEIKANLLSILFAEPANNQPIFSDNLQQSLKADQQASHSYRINLSNGAFNLYTYLNGQCMLIELNSGLVKLTLKRI